MFIKRAITKNAILGVIDTKRENSDNLSVCCSVCGKCFKNTSEAQSCKREDCPFSCRSQK